MEKVTLHMDTEGSEWHFLIATLRERENKNNFEIPTLPKYQMSSKAVV